MIFYRMYFRARREIVERSEFQAETDGVATSAAAMVFDAGSDRCDGWDLWDGGRLVADQKTTKELLAQAKEVSEKAQIVVEVIACAIEEGIVAANGLIARSPNMRAKLGVLHSNGRHRRS